MQGVLTFWPAAVPDCSSAVLSDFGDFFFFFFFIIPERVKPFLKE